MRMSRRYVLSGLACALAVGSAGAAAATLRWHASPRRAPYLTDAHLRGLALPAGDGPRVLFIGNSMLLRHDVPGRVAAAAAREGITLRPALAAAQGARLIETLRIDALEDVMRPGLWEALVLQDFTKTPLRAVDRWGSACAIKAMARRVAPTPVLLAPPWPARAGANVYAGAGFLTDEPASPEEYATRTMAHYSAVARDISATVAPLPPRWLTADQDLYDPDGHHANPDGASLMAEVIWTTLRDII